MVTFTFGNEVRGGFPFEGGSQNDGHDAQEGCHHRRVGISGVEGRLGSGWFVYGGALCESVKADHRGLYCGAAYFHDVPGGREEKGLQCGSPGLVGATL